MFSRNDRLRELFRTEIVKALREVKDPGLSGFLTITDVEISADRKTAKVFYSILGSPATASTPTPAPKKKTKMSAAARAKIAAAQKARWAKAKTPVAKPAAKPVVKKKSTMSAAGRAKISAAEGRAMWSR